MENIDGVDQAHTAEVTTQHIAKEPEDGQTYSKAWMQKRLTAHSPNKSWGEREHVGGWWDRREMDLMLIGVAD